MDEKIKREYKVERIKKRRKTGLEKGIIIVGVLFFAVLMIYANLVSFTPSKQDKFMKVAREIKKNIEDNYMSCKYGGDIIYNNDIIRDDCSLADDYSKKVIAFSGYSEKDIKEVVVNLNSKKMRLVATDGGFYDGVTVVELNLQID